MKRKSAVVLLGVLMISQASLLWAAPERLEIKDAGKRAKEQTAKAQMKNLNLQGIEDPVARKAIRELCNYLNIQTSN